MGSEMCIRDSADTDQCCKRRKQRDDGRADAGACQGNISDLRDISDINAINDAVKNVDKLREHKKETPFSGTTAVFNMEGDAFYFSKNIIPAIRKEEKVRAGMETSPVYRQVGLYGYRLDVLRKIAKLPEGVYEKLEGLEQLRWIENGIKVRCVKVDYRNYGKMASLSGVDSPEDVARVEAVLAEYGL